MSAGLAETAACISCVQVLVPGQQKQEKSSDTDGHTVSICRLLLEIHLINSIYGNSALVFMWFVWMLPQIWFLHIWRAFTGVPILLCWSVMFHKLHKLLFGLGWSIFFCIPSEFCICCHSSNNDREPSSCPGRTGHPREPNPLAKCNNHPRPKPIWRPQSQQVHEWTAQHPQWVTHLTHSSSPRTFRPVWYNKCIQSCQWTVMVQPLKTASWMIFRSNIQATEPGINLYVFGKACEASKYYFLLRAVALSCLKR